MPTLRDIRNRILSVKNIEKITSAMKMVSSVKVRKAQKLIETSRLFFDKIENMLVTITNTDKTYYNPLLTSNSEFNKNIVILIIGGDKGLCGAFNNNLFKAVDNYLTTTFIEKYPLAISPKLILIGNKTIEHYTKNKNNYNILYSFSSAFQPLDYNIVTKNHELIINDFLNKKIDKVEIFYNRLVNPIKQEPTHLQLLPLNIENKQQQIKIKQIDYIFEPNNNIIIDALINQYFNLTIWNSLLESNAAEQSARLLAMDKATQNANDLIKELELQFNNARQNAITTEMLEIVSGVTS